MSANYLTATIMFVSGDTVAIVSAAAVPAAVRSGLAATVVIGAAWGAW